MWIRCAEQLEQLPDHEPDVPPSDCGIPEVATERGHERRLLAERRECERDEDQDGVVDVEATQRSFARAGSHRRESLASRNPSSTEQATLSATPRVYVQNSSQAYRS
jgi:hypothetical protein